MGSVNKKRTSKWTPERLTNPRRLPVYDSEEGIALLKRIAEVRGFSSGAAMLRHLVREEAVRLGLLELKQE